MIAIRTQTEVARIMTERGDPMKKSTVQSIEKSALEKLAPQLQSIAQDLGFRNSLRLKQTGEGGSP